MNSALPFSSISFKITYTSLVAHIGPNRTKNLAKTSLNDVGTLTCEKWSITFSSSQCCQQLDYCNFLAKKKSALPFVDLLATPNGCKYYLPSVDSQRCDWLRE